MSIKIGNIDVANEIIDLRYQTIRLQLILENIINNNNNIKAPTMNELKLIDDETLEKLKKIYPDMIKKG
jgi:hypothetical protein